MTAFGQTGGVHLVQDEMEVARRRFRDIYQLDPTPVFDQLVQALDRVAARRAHPCRDEDDGA